MSFEVAADAYARFMGRYAEPLGPLFLGFAGTDGVRTALDVGCGPGTLTGLLVDLLGAEQVAAIDPSAPFVEAVRHRLPGCDVRTGVAERLPWPDGSFDLAVAQLVVHFLTDQVAGLRELGRVVRPGGRVAACVWDLSPGAGPLSLFWDAVAEVDPTVVGESSRPGTLPGQLESFSRAAGLAEVTGDRLTVRVRFASLEDWWQPFTLGVGPAGGYVASLSDPARDRLRAACADRLPAPPFELAASAWAVRARSPR